MENFPFEIKQKLFVSLYLKNGPSAQPIVTTSFLNSPEFLPICEEEVIVKISVSSAEIARMANSHFERASKEINKQFAEKIAELELTRSKFLALEN